MSTDTWSGKAGAIVAIATLMLGAGGIIATVALYQGRIEERVQQVDKRLERMESKLDQIAPPTVRIGGPTIQSVRPEEMTYARKHP